MISAPDRRQALALIDAARTEGARLALACRIIGITARTYRRWRSQGGRCRDHRPEAVRPRPKHTLSPRERDDILALCHERRFASLPPGQIVPILADEGRYIASESSFYRVLRDAGEQQHRGRSRTAREARPLATHQARAPNQVWCWDISYLPGPMRGLFYYLYLILDLYSRKIVAAEVFEAESGANAAALVRRAVLREGCINQPLVLHADNGSPMKGATLLATLQGLGVTPSWSRPRVSNDNAYAESLFRTCKYRPDYPAQGFASLEEAREWVERFAHWYNNEHRHAGIRFVTPAERHRGEDAQILAQREAVYAAAQAANPARWSGSTRNWTPVGAVWLNPVSENEKTLDAA
jgi:putative transposase